MKKTLLIPLLVLMLFATPVMAQEDTLPEAGTTPASPFYFAERFFEGVGTFFTFGNSAKAERYLNLAEERLAEARELAEEGDERAERAVERYEEQVAKAKERAERTGEVDLEATVADATTKHLSALDQVLERVPEQARASIEAAKERSMNGQLESLRGLVERDPERAVEIYDRAAEGRLRAVEARANRGGAEGDEEDTEDAEDAEEALEEFEKYSEFGREISNIAQGLQTGETTVEELVERATSRHQEILSGVRERVPEQAREGIDRAMDNSRMADRPSAERGQSENSNIPERAQNRNSLGSDETEAETEDADVESIDEDDDDDGISTEVEQRAGNVSDNAGPENRRR
ncbi:ATP synthase F0 subunit B [Candidatus Parcubacteria bacterium]|nr:ATP synthase F0 subunit B [Candidatus Parcubacteria bacterium]